MQLVLTPAHSFLLRSLNSGPGGRRFKSSLPDHLSPVRPGHIGGTMFRGSSTRPFTICCSPS
jgi:hypothetical protein